ncbi:hypothetical protein E4656_12715 [Natronospirillum operosum]|uniref:Uncharacterized protein n=1 Tax=Natronospirillum operosum TaxID=2759953 RepID=A0A4Z0WBS8_9GAMM|nr:hypothetical protein [Natronospirillum operosum]TGG92335.1 hypothetical protein E4656_12715 [Natronospirillum operosum]
MNIVQPPAYCKPDLVSTSHRAITVWYPGGRSMEQLDLARLREVQIISQTGHFLWQLLGEDLQVLLIPFGTEGEGDMRRELQVLPGFETDLLFAWLDGRNEAEPPLLLWRP